ncbi:DUF4269 domain-containing protein [Ornithinibacillus halophilus]|uniref:DUF4269 domain-containing protein n=1 Tax=Ornithinibacillus halophilus TaxID=930117 RepID=A0A1M5L8K9_9BACI|nr:DUF4269 domain-containing protein [Ornithinibacillus halophilus]SHG61367.1 protein of unknown function [Ornithinibacillus halophilus]
MFSTIDYLKKGNKGQRKAYHAISRLGIIDSLSDYDPILCGTLPIGINSKNSDLDIIMEVQDFQSYEKKVRKLYGNKEDFRIKRLQIRGRSVVKANFIFDGFEFELFGQDQPVKEQNAYLHMIIEDSILKQFPDIRKEVIKLKKQGLKTEPAFCKVLQLKGDNPYEVLLNYGKQKGMI